MSAGTFRPLPKSPEWLHSARYLLIALVLHGLVLLYPLSLQVDQREITPPVPLQVKLSEKVLPVPALLPPPPPVMPTVAKPPLRKKPVPTAQPIIALARAPSSAPPTFSVAAPIVAPPVSQPVAPVPATAAPATVTAARFDAAYLQNPHPEYPPVSRRLGEEGKVLLRVRVTPDGRAAAVEVEKSSNFVRLDDAALRSVTRWRFTPAKRGDEAIEATVIVPIVFRLDS